MRSIKFRVWHHTLNKFIPADEWYLDLNGRLCFLDIKGITDDYLIEVEESLYTAQQYTGIKDKNGKDIYEGDVITFTKRGITHGPDAEDVKNAEVWYSFEDCAFVFGKYKSADYTWWYSMADDLRDFEVVGNIFENKDLLK